MNNSEYRSRSAAAFRQSCRALAGSEGTLLGAVGSAARLGRRGWRLLGGQPRAPAPLREHSAPNP